MKKFIVFFLCVLSLSAYAQNEITDPNTNPPKPTVKADDSISFMGRTLYFSHWEYVRNLGQGCTYAGALENPILKLEPTENCLDYRHIPEVSVIYFPNHQHRNHNESASFLYAKEERFILSTDGHQDPYAYEVYISQLNKQDLNKNPIQTCKGKMDTVHYRVFPYKNPVISVSRGTPWGYIHYSVRINMPEQNKSNTAQNTIQRKDLKQIARQIMDALCSFEYPQWLKDVPTIEEIKNQNVRPQKPAESTPANKKVAPKK